MSKRLKVKCDKCGVTITLSQRKIITKEIDIGETLSVQYFKCGNCKEIFIISVDNVDTEEIKKLYQRCRDSIKLAKMNVIMSDEAKENTIAECIKRAETLSKNCKDMQDKLLSRYKKRILPILM